MTRPTLQDIIDAYQKTGLKPAPGRYINRYSNEACAIGALVCAHTDTSTFSSGAIGEWAEKHYGAVFADGVVSGFDNLEPATREYSYGAGYTLGQQARKALITREAN